MSDKEIKSSLEKYYEAFHSKNWEMFEQCLSDNFKYFTDNAKSMTRSSFIEFLKRDPWQGIEYRISDLEIRVSEHDDMGLALYRTYFRGLINGKENILEAAETTIFIKENNVWKAFHSHTSNKVQE